MTFRHLAHWVFCLGVSLFHCAAQVGETVTLQFLSFPKAIDSKPVELFIGEGKTIKVETPSNEISTPYKVRRQTIWAVGETVTGKDGKPVFNVFGKAAALASSQQMVLLIHKGKENADGFEVLPIDSRGTEFGGGKFLFMNAAKIDIGGVVGGEKFTIKPGTHTIIKPKPGDNGRTFLAMFYFRKDDKPKPFFSSTWPMSDKARGLIFFYHDPETQRLRIHSIRDFE